MKMALPMNSSLFISGEMWGMYRLRISPAKKAPNTPSMPTICENTALIKSMDITKINCITASLYLRKNHLVRRGMSMIMPVQYIPNFTMKNTQKSMPSCLLNDATKPAKMTKAISNEIMLEPTLSVTLGFCCNPYLDTIG